MENPSTSKSFNKETSLTGDDLVQLVNDLSSPVCILDCRTDGPAVKGASRVRLPNVLYRRLQNGSLALSNVSPLLSDRAARVVIIPGIGPDASTSDALANALKKDGYFFRVLTENVDKVLNECPSLNGEDSSAKVDLRDRGASSPEVRTGCLNLNALRIEPETEASSRAEKKTQQFPVKILEHLYLGNYETAKSAEQLEACGIHHIINVTSNLDNVFEDDPKFKYLRISVDDNSSHNLIQYFPEAIAFIDAAEQAGDACLVHCLAGISRSVTICLAYLMCHHRMCLEEAYDLVLRRNASIAPNFHFMGQLTDYERQMGIRGTVGTYSAVPPRSPSCAAEVAAATSGLLTPPPTSCSASPQSSAHSAKSFD